MAYAKPEANHVVMDGLAGISSTQGRSSDRVMS